MRKVFLFCLSFIFAVFLVVGCTPDRNTAEVDPLPTHEAGVLFADKSDPEYSSVLSDLERSEDFDIANYPTVSGDASLNLIQIAESLDGEVLVYVYQPGGKVAALAATEIRLSTGINESLKYDDYKLMLLNSDETLYKYKIEGLTVSNSMIRYYDVAQISRLWDSRYDKRVSDNSVSTVPYKVGRRWEALTLDNVVYYNVVDVEVITITDKLVGWIRYPNGMGVISTSACDGHFVAFSTDHDIDRLLQAYVSFVVQSYKKSLSGEMSYGAEVPKTVELSYDQKTSNSAGGLFGKKYTWQRIQSAEDFATNDALDSEGKKKIREKQWVLNFYETEFTVPVGGANILLGGLVSLGIAAAKGSTGSVVSDVTILELTFETDGEVYNMGAVDNKQTGSYMGSAKDTLETFTKIWTWLQKYWYVPLICLGAFVVLCVVLKLCLWIGSRR